MPAKSFAIEVNPAVLRWARTSAGQSTASVAGHLGVHELTVDHWEAGRKSPDWNSLKKLAAYYHRPVATLLLPKPPDEASLPDFRKIAQSSQRDLSAPTLLAIRTARWLQARAVELRQELQLPRPSLGKTRLSEDAEQTASSIRQSLGVTVSEQTEWRGAYEAYRRWRGATEEQGVFVFQFAFPREESQGFSLYDADCPVIVVNESDLPQARAFTLFHEYAHLLLRTPGICLPTITAAADEIEIERFCNRFAASVLIPLSVVRSWRASYREGVSERVLRELAQQYRVSKYVVLITFKTGGCLSDDAFARIYRGWQAQDAARPIRTRRPGGGGPSAAKKSARQRGKSFTSLVLEAARRGAVTTRDAAAYLGVKTKDISRLEP